MAWRADLYCRAETKHEEKPTLDRPAAARLWEWEAFADLLGALLRDERDSQTDAFVFLLDGAWGSGKSTILWRLGENLRRRDPPWLVVEFNAARQQRAGAPWWRLIEAVYQKGVHDLAPARSLALRWDALVFRVRLAWPWLLAFGLAVALLLLFGVLAAAGRLDTGGAVVATAGTLVGIIAGVLGLARSLSASTAGGVEQFLRRAPDPVSTLEQRYRTLIERIGRPVVVLIDDLDRCRPQVVIDLVEGVRTIIGSVVASYVVAADSRRLAESYADLYGGDGERRASRTALDEFLAGTFDLSARCPRLRPRTLAASWEALVSSLNQSRETADFATSKYADGLDEPGSDRFLQPSTETEAALRQLSAPDWGPRASHQLARLESLLEPDPRAMRRLVSGYRLERALETLEGNALALAQPAEKLALWTIVRSRWPLLADALARRPQLVDELKRDGPLPEVEAEAEPNANAHLLRQARRVVRGEGLDGVDLDAAAVELFSQ